MTPGMVENVTARRELLLANLFLLGLMIVGTLGYMFIEHWAWHEALYMTFITLSTIGFREVHEMSVGGRMFTMFVGLAGIGSVAFIATRSVQLLLSSGALKLRQMTKMIDKLENHYILAGYGRIGSRVAQDLKRNKTPFIIIENQPEKSEMLDSRDMLYIRGDAEQEETLMKAGIERAKGLILTLPEDRANVFATLVARELNPDLFILVRTDTHLNRRKLIRAGADKVVSPYEIGADRMAQVILRPNVDRFFEQVLQAETLNYTMDEVIVEEGSLLAGSSLADANFRQRFEAIVVAIMDGETLELSFNPSPSQTIQAGDTLIVMGNLDVISTLKKDGCQPT